MIVPIEGPVSNYALAHQQVPQEVFRRLCSAPNPATYWEDRIAEEYPTGVHMTSAASTTTST